MCSFNYVLSGKVDLMNSSMPAAFDLTSACAVVSFDITSGYTFLILLIYVHTDTENMFTFTEWLSSKGGNVSLWIIVDGDKGNMGTLISFILSSCHLLSLSV